MKPILSISILLISILYLGSQSLTFSRVYKTTYYEDARYVCASGDGTFVVTGLDKSVQDHTGDLYVMKINAVGAIMWKKYYGIPKEDGGNFILKTHDEGYLISGHSNNTPDEECDGYLVKIDRHGNEEWRLFIGTALDEVCHGAVETADGSYYVTGRYEEPSGNHQFDFLIAKVSRTGKLEWMKPIHRLESEEGNRIALTDDNHIIIAGYSKNQNTTDENLLVMKTDLNGNLIWEKSWSLPLHERALLLIPMSNGSFIIGGGSANQQYVNSCQSLILKSLDKNGEVISEFESMIDGFEFSYLFDGHKINDHSIAVSGIYSELEKPFVAVFDDHLRIQKISRLENIEHSRPLSFAILNSNEVLICGKEITEDQDLNIWLGRTSIATIGVLKSKDLEQEELITFPNPWNDHFYIYTSDEGKKSIHVFQPGGNCILEYNYSGKELFLLNKDLPLTGTYFYDIRNEGGKLLQKGSFIKN